MNHHGDGAPLLRHVSVALRGIATEGQKQPTNWLIQSGPVLCVEVSLKSSGHALDVLTTTEEQQFIGHEVGARGLTSLHSGPGLRENQLGHAP